MVAEAQRTRPPIQRMVDTVSGYSVPAVVTAAVATCIAWAIWEPAPGMSYAVIAAVSVHFVACPCARGLAAPMSVGVDIGKGEGVGILIKSAEALERMEKVDTLVVDKKGTLTEVELKVTAIVPVAGRSEAGTRDVQDIDGGRAYSASSAARLAYGTTKARLLRRSPERSTRPITSYASPLPDHVLAQKILILLCFDNLTTANVQQTVSDERSPKLSMTRRSPHPRRVLVLGATGTVGRGTVHALIQSGHDVVCFVRGLGSAGSAGAHDNFVRSLPEAAELRFGEITDPNSLARDGIRGEHFDAIISCLASRSGAPKDAWAVDYSANMNALAAAKAACVPHMVLLSAICVQKPRLAFQHAKLAFESALIESGLTYTIVRPTALFKSLSGQIDRLKKGKSFLMFGDGTLTACKPISDDDLGSYLAECLDDKSRHNCVLPIGGPGEPITPKQQGEHLFTLLNRTPEFRRVPLALLDATIWILGALGHVLPSLAEKAELARIGRYYATESMLVLDPATGGYDPAATPATGSETLFDFYDRVIASGASIDRGDHAVF
jgi:divinyl chlorophyllide a 8-vinyl-reductase